MRLLLAGGGTGGHLFPALAVAETLRQQDAAAAVLFVGTERGLEARLLPAQGWELATVDMIGVAGRSLRAKLAILPRLGRSLLQARTILRRFRPDVVLGVGGYASVPVVLAAALARVPVVLHEQNALPGLANRLLARLARTVCLSFATAAPAFGRRRTLVTGNPVRAAIAASPEVLPAAASLLVFGGSQGARAINEALLAALPELQRQGVHCPIVHQTGVAEAETVAAGYRQAGWTQVTVTPFIEDMATAYAQASLVVCRAGATTLAELAAAGRPAILIPYPHAAADHQTANAQAVAAVGAAILLPQAALTGAVLAAQIAQLLADATRLQTMAEAARTLAQPAAAEQILAHCRAAAGKGA